MSDKDNNTHCECSECGTVTNCVISDRGRPLCFDCGHEEATRQMKADAPGVWPDWADKIKDYKPTV
jgi:hypothetical protein